MVGRCGSPVERVLVLALAKACVLDGRDVIPFRECVAALNRRTKTALLPVMGRFSACKQRRRTSSERDVRFSEPRDLRGFDARGRAIKKLQYSRVNCSVSKAAKRMMNFACK